MSELKIDPVRAPNGLLEYANVDYCQHWVGRIIPTESGKWVFEERLPCADLDFCTGAREYSECAGLVTDAYLSYGLHPISTTDNPKLGFVLYWDLGYNTPDCVSIANRTHETIDFESYSDAGGGYWDYVDRIIDAIDPISLRGFLTDWVDYDLDWIDHVPDSVLDAPACYWEQATGRALQEIQEIFSDWAQLQLDQDPANIYTCEIGSEMVRIYRK